MPYKTVTTTLTDLYKDQGALELALALAGQCDGHVDALCLGVDYSQPSYSYMGANAMALHSGLVQAEAAATKLEQEVTKRLKGETVSWACRALAPQALTVAQLLGYHSRFADIVVLPRPYGDKREQISETILESALFEAQVPTLVLPDAAAPSVNFTRIAIAWNESREALRAVRAALPLLKQAKHVHVVVVDPPVHAPDRSDPGGLLSQMLARHQVNIEVNVLARTLPNVSDVLARFAADAKVDLMVMGAYGHSRLRESILGGATRNTLENTNIPVLMMH